MGNFQSELKKLLNMYSQENASDTPDFVLAEYLIGCLTAYNKAVRSRAMLRCTAQETPSVAKVVTATEEEH